jgi:hypothetical protein
MSCSYRTDEPITLSSPCSLSFCPYAAPPPGSSCPIDIICETTQGKAFQLLATAQTDKDLTKNPPVGSKLNQGQFTSVGTVTDDRPGLARLMGNLKLSRERYGSP